MKCYRCGFCCYYMKMIPKYDDSDLSPDNLDRLSRVEGYEALDKYLEENSEWSDDKCKWLDDREVIAKCTVYERRSSMCRDFGSDVDECRIGKSRQQRTRKFYRLT